MGVFVGVPVGVLVADGVLVKLGVGLGVFVVCWFPNARLRSCPGVTVTVWTPGGAGKVCVQPAWGTSKTV